MNTLSRKAHVVVVLSCLLAAGAAVAVDSTQFRGSNRDGKYPETDLLKSWPAGGPELLWTTTGLGRGYSSVSVVGDTIYAAGMKSGNQGYIFIIDAATGAITKELPYGTDSAGGPQGPGARSTPTIEDNRLYVMSGRGQLTCFNLPSGSQLWQVDVMGRFSGVRVQWDNAESILIDGGNVICTPGGPGASIVALNKMNGNDPTVWQSTGLSEPSSYCSPNIINHNGNRILITMTQTSVVGMDPANGTLLWKHAHPTNSDVHAVTPLYADGRVYYTAGYGSGGGILNLSPDGSSITPGWSNTVLDCQHEGVVLLDGHVYGTAQQNPKELVCLDVATGQSKWRTTQIKKGGVVYADGMLYVYEDPSGVVSLVKASPSAYERVGSFTIPGGSNEHWAHPTIANGRMYLQHGSTLFAYNIADPAAGDGDGDGGAGSTAQPEAGMPVAGVIGLGLLAGAVALGGTRVLRKK